MFADFLLAGFRRRRQRKAEAGRLYGLLVRQTRQPAFYRDLGVPDSFDGRFDLLVLHAYLLFRRLRGDKPHGPALAQAVFDTMFADMDIVLREQGVGDMAIGKKIKAMAQAFYGRVKAYDESFRGDDTALAAALARNVYAGKVDAPHAAELARYCRTTDAALAQADFTALAAGAFSFLPWSGPARLAS